MLLFVNLGLPILSLFWGWKLNKLSRKRKKAAAEAAGDTTYVPIELYKAANESPMVQRQRRLGQLSPCKPRTAAANGAPLQPSFY